VILQVCITSQFGVICEQESGLEVRPCGMGEI
jgi:hypothetical protein